MVKRLEYKCIAAVLFALYFLIFTCEVVESKTNKYTNKAHEMLSTYHYAHWVISKKQSFPHIVVPDSIGDYKKMEPDFQYYVGRNDRLGRLVMSELWLREREVVPFPLPEIELKIGQRKYFIISKDNKLEEIEYYETEGNSSYILIYKYISTFPGEVGEIDIRRQLVTQYLSQRQEFIYEGKQLNASRVITKKFDRPQ